MDYTDVKEWLDVLAERYKISVQTSYLTPRIAAGVNTNSCVLIYENIEIVADIMNLELVESPCDDGWFSYRFEYDGVGFVSYKKGRLESFERRDREQNGC